MEFPLPANYTGRKYRPLIFQIVGCAVLIGIGYLAYLGISEFRDWITG